LAEQAKAEAAAAAEEEEEEEEEERRLTNCRSLSMSFRGRAGY
jgi:ribosomal protein L12E/L44/L45/RPP1/RPP2